MTLFLAGRLFHPETFSRDLDFVEKMTGPVRKLIHTFQKINDEPPRLFLLSIVVNLGMVFIGPVPQRACRLPQESAGFSSAVETD